MFKDVLDSLLRESGINALTLSREIKVPKTVVYAWKNGERTPGMEHLKLLSDYFNVSLERLCEKEDPVLPADEAELIAMLRSTKNISDAAYERIIGNIKENLRIHLSNAGGKGRNGEPKP
ncbi:MAG: helix-turn-helix transcriptional regulator [Clostridia bacterium]|nr:helix-turn-helix transcriptional regulator [Clostridia bacterium]MBR5767609.1 helix-turn-helix transcriptional regulator [Clostridia bacterium]